MPAPPSSSPPHAIELRAVQRGAPASTESRSTERSAEKAGGNPSPGKTNTGGGRLGCASGDMTRLFVRQQCTTEQSLSVEIEDIPESHRDVSTFTSPSHSTEHCSPRLCMGGRYDEGRAESSPIQVMEPGMPSQQRTCSGLPLCGICEGFTTCAYSIQYIIYRKMCPLLYQFIVLWRLCTLCGQSVCNSIKSAIT